MASILTSEAGIEDQHVLMAALLHDTVEDTNTTFDEIEKHFGTIVRSIVEEVICLFQELTICKYTMLFKLFPFYAKSGNR